MADAAPRPHITPELTVGAFLEAYPQLEETLIAIAPPFANLRNPLLRRTVARLTSLRQAAVVGGVPVGEMIRTLRQAAGQSAGGEEDGAREPGASTSRPEWMRDEARAAVFDARATLDAGEVPLPQILKALAALAPGQVYTVVTPFVPAPLLERIRQAGFDVWTEELAPGEHHTHCHRPAAAND